MESTEPKRNISCFLHLALVGLVMLGLLVSILADPVRRQEFVESILECLAGAGMCLGVVVLAFTCLVLWIRFFTPEPDSGLDYLGRRYAARCYAVEMPAMGSTQGEASSAALTTQLTSYPIYLLVSHMNYGIGLEPLAPQHFWKWSPADNADRFRQLSSGRSGLIVVPIGYFSLYYVPYHQQGNLTFEMAPAHQAGYTGPLQALPPGRQVKIVITYTSVMDPENLTQTIALERPVKLKLVAVDDNGEDDPVATLALYNELLPAEAPDEYESWMYRSRPIIGPWC